MPVEFSRGPHPDILYVRVYSELEPEDVLQPSGLGLEKHRRLYVLADLSEMAVRLPPNFLELVRQSPLAGARVNHVALVTRSETLGALGRVVGKLVGREGLISVHGSAEAARAHLLGLLKDADTPPPGEPAAV